MVKLARGRILPQKAHQVSGAAAHCSGHTIAVHRSEKRIAQPEGQPSEPFRKTSAAPRYGGFAPAIRALHKEYAVTIVIYKILAAPALILLSTLAARRWGEFAGGVLAGLPTISGVASLFLALEQGMPFAAQAAFHSLYGVVVCCLLTLTYIWAAMRFPWYIALPASLIVYVTAGYGVRFLPDSLWLASFCALSGPPLVILLLPRTAGALKNLPRQRPGWAVPAQMLCALLLVLFLTGYAQRLGTVWSGILLFFPVMVIILGSFAHATMGAWAARQIIKGLMTGFIGGTAFSVIIACLLGALPLWPCYALATAAALSLSAAATMAARAASGKGRPA